MQMRYPLCSASYTTGCQYPVTLLCSQSTYQCSGRSSLWIWWVEVWVLRRSKAVILLEDWRLYLSLTQKGVVLLTCINLLCLTPPSLSVFTLPLSSSSSPCFPVSTLHREADWFLLTEMLPSSFNGEIKRVGERSESIVSLCSDLQKC